MMKNGDKNLSSHHENGSRRKSGIKSTIVGCQKKASEDAIKRAPTESEKIVILRRKWEILFCTSFFATHMQLIKINGNLAARKQPQRIIADTTKVLIDLNLC